MSLVREAMEKEAGKSRQPREIRVVEYAQPAPAPAPRDHGGQRSGGNFSSGFSKGMGQGLAGLTLVGLVGAGLAGARHMRRQKAEASFHQMASMAGHEFEGLSPQDQHRAKVYHAAIAQHSPTVAMDPIASWNHVSHFLRHPSTYQPQTIEQLQKVETGRPMPLSQLPKL